MCHRVLLQIVDVHRFDVLEIAEMSEANPTSQGMKGKRMLTGLSLVKKLKKFKDNESGAITVDWVVLSAAIVGLGVSGVGALQNAADNLAVALSQGVSAPSDD